MTTQSQMLEVPISHLLEKADKLAREDSSSHNQYTMKGLRARQIGFLGELIGLEHLTNCKVEFEPHFTIEYDVLFKTMGMNKKLEFKTKERSVEPKDYYDCSVFEYNKDFQMVDNYMFMSLVSLDRSSEDINRFTKGFILGSISREKFLEIARLEPRGIVDSSNGWSPTKNTWNVPISSLNPPLVPSGVVTHGN